MYKALKTFGGLVSMRRGELKDISNPTIVKDLLKAGYIEEVKPAKSKSIVEETTETPDEKPEKPKRKNAKVE